MGSILVIVATTLGWFASMLAYRPKSLSIFMDENAAPTQLSIDREKDDVHIRVPIKIEVDNILGWSTVVLDSDDFKALNMHLSYSRLKEIIAEEEGDTDGLD